ncbi:MAG: DUF4093 domain-containing protein [Clostridia bacterium]|nr:DUF4093 domain-containing protein [Clostridia bacterium]
MYTIKETIIVEGMYDKIKLSGFIDSLIFITGGFAIFNNKQAQQSIRTLAEKTGIVILTDSDSAGLKIRNFVKQLVPKEQVRHAYIPEICGKERRKNVCSKEGLLGVEGVCEDIIIKALTESGCTINGEAGKKKKEKSVTKTDFYSLGLSGGDMSAKLRRDLAIAMGLPSKISANMLLDAVNKLLTYEELTMMVENIKKM